MITQSWMTDHMTHDHSWAVLGSETIAIVAETIIAMVIYDSSQDDKLSEGVTYSISQLASYLAN